MQLLDCFVELLFETNHVFVGREVDRGMAGLQLAGNFSVHSDFQLVLAALLFYPADFGTLAHQTREQDSAHSVLELSQVGQLSILLDELDSHGTVAKRSWL